MEKIFNPAMKKWKNVVWKWEKPVAQRAAIGMSV